MSDLNFQDWMKSGGTIFNGEEVSTQAGSKDVKAQAGGNTDTSPRAKAPKVQSKNISIKDSGVTSITTQAKEQPEGKTITKPTIHAPTVHEVQPESVIASNSVDIFTPQVKLTDIFSVNMQPSLTIK